MNKFFKTQKELPPYKRKHKKAWITWPGKLRGYRLMGLFFGYSPDDPEDNTSFWKRLIIVRGCKFGWYSSQMYETLYLGPCALCWTWC